MLHHQSRAFVEQVHAERVAHTPLPADAAELEQLVRRAAARDERAWESLFVRFNARVQAVARMHGLARHDVDDIVQSTWLRMFIHIGRLRQPASFGAYLHTTARHESLRNVVARAPEQLVEYERVADARDEPEARLLDAERRACLAAALEALPEHQRRLAKLLVAEPALGYQEIADALEIPIGSIGPTRARCLERLARDPQLASVAVGE